MTNATEKKGNSELSIDFSGDAVVEIAGELRKLLADVFALYVKTKNFHWHMSGRHFRDYHLLLDEQGTQIFAMTDDIRDQIMRKVEEVMVRGGMLANLCVESRLRELLEQGFEVAVAKDATRAPKHPEWGYRYSAPLINCAYLPYEVWTAD
jgi:hypothetical protein